jgi:hypothetical protein
MPKKLDFEKLRHTGKPALSIADEAEYQAPVERRENPAPFNDPLDF